MTAFASTPVALAPRPRTIAAALQSVCDPEYPDISIVDLGLVEQVGEEVDETGGHVTVGLIPTFSGCPALSMIADDVRTAVESVGHVSACEVTWLDAPVWTVDRTSLTARRRLEEDYTVVVRRSDGSLRCPVCGSGEVTDQSMAGPTRCRSVAWCDSCRNVIEVMR